MKTPLHIIGNNKLYGLADSNEIEIVECVYDNIKHLKSGKYIVIKDKMAGILDERGKILLYLQPNRLYTIQQMEIFYYNVNGKKVYFSFVNNQIYYISVDKIRYDQTLQILNVWKDGELKIYNYNFSQIQTSYEQIELTDLRQGNSKFYLGKKNGMWGVFRIKRPLKHEPEIITTFEAIYCNSEEALLTLKKLKRNTGRRHHRGTKNIINAEGKENNN